MSIEDRLITIKECARLAGVSRTTCYHHRLRPDFPVGVLVTATRKRFWRTEVITWLEQRRDAQ